VPARASPAHRLALAGPFLRAAAVYWTGVFPQVARELRRWRARALAIPDPALREQALSALAKRGNMEGAAAFATFAPRAHRGAVVRATVAFQAAYNHLDVLSEQPAEGDAFQRSLRLHRALLAALDPGQPDPETGDGGYLAGMVDACRAALSELPSYRTAMPAALRAAERVVAFQAHQAGGRGREGSERIERWARTLAPPDADLRWWEAAGAAGSSLGVHAVIALAAERELEPERVAALERACFPWIGALHSLLDHLIDAEEDAAAGQRNLIACYEDAAKAAERMALLTRRALAAARALPAAPRHELIVAAMASFYLAAPQAAAPAAAPVAHAVLRELGPLAGWPMAVFKARYAAARLRSAMSLRLRPRPKALTTSCSAAR
jgi:tetraprenyl-beta-curcumene synthase